MPVFIASFFNDGLKAFSPQAREIFDMAGRRVTVPDTILSVCGISPPGTYMKFAIIALILRNAWKECGDRLTG